MSRGNSTGVEQAPKVDRKPWDRLPDETPRAFACFEIYRTLTPHQRSYKAVREHFERPKGYDRHLQRWGSQHRWASRAAQWDTHLADLRTRELEKGHRLDLEDMRQRTLSLHKKALRLAETMLEACQNTLDKHIRVDESGDVVLVLPLEKVSTFARAASAVANTSAEVAGMTLSIGDVLDHVGSE